MARIADMSPPAIARRAIPAAIWPRRGRAEGGGRAETRRAGGAPRRAPPGAPRGGGPGGPPARVGPSVAEEPRQNPHGGMLPEKRGSERQREERRSTPVKKYAISVAAVAGASDPWTTFF